MTDRLKSTGRHWGSRVVLAAVVGACAGSARAEVAPEGANYPIVGTPAGDQTNPGAAFGASRGFLVWQDNATDGDGLGISARRLDSSGNPVGDAFRVNQTAAGDQENPKVTVLPDGSTVFVWQSGERGSQKVFARILGANGIFKTGDIELNAEGSDNRNPVIVALTDGSAAIAWASSAADGNQLGIHALRLGADGQKVGDLVAVNQFAAYNQRQPAIASLPAGGFAVAWISEQQTGQNRTDVYLRRFSNAGIALGDEARVNAGEQPCAGTSLVALADGALAVAWSQLDLSGAKANWTVAGRWLDSQGTAGAVVPLSADLAGANTQPQLAVSGDRILATWLGSGVHSKRIGVGARLVDLAGNAVGPVMTLDVAGNGDQVSPAVASRGGGKFVTLWSNWSGLAAGMDLVAQRFAPEAAPLAALDAPVVQGLSSWQIKAAWAPAVGLALKQYEVYFDGSATPEVTTDSFWASPDVLPGSTHSVQVAYVLVDGRRSPLSAAAQGKSWGKDSNGDGLPDDWQATYFGPNSAQWPAPGADSDGDGVSNRDEFFSGTSPVEKADVLKVSVGVTGQGYLLNWSSHAGGVYQLQSSTDLANWSNVGGYRFATSGGDSVIVNSVPANSYFRVNRIR
ncbi:MAG: hypothetical protein DVB31_09130 [Verrucomicrobia bacterium]|nr:MAG: hypothetical protein DVB31_09130 [Verrucomicrobiota bacterium]